MEVSEARGIFATLKERLNNSDNVKADKTEVEGTRSSLQSQINGLASGSPLVANSTEEMTDTSRVYVNTSDGHWYTYNGSNWVDGGVYQGIEIADDAVALNQLSEDTRKQINTSIPEYVLTNGHYISFNEKIIKDEPNYSYSSPILLKAGEKIVFKSMGYTNATSMITITDVAGSTINPVVKAISMNEEIYEYQNSYDTECYVMLCGRTTNFKAYIDTKESVLINNYLLRQNLFINNQNNLIPKNEQFNALNIDYSIDESQDLYKTVLNGTINNPTGQIINQWSYYLIRKITFEKSIYINNISFAIDIMCDLDSIELYIMDDEFNIYDTITLKNISNTKFNRYFFEAKNINKILNGLRWGIATKVSSSIENINFSIRLMAYAINSNIYQLSNNIFTPYDLKIITNVDNSSEENPLSNLDCTGGLMNIFTKICCFGDSLTFGQYDRTSGSDSVDTSNYNYPSHLKRMLNCDVKVFAKSGATPLSWLQDFEDIAFLENNKSECYIIALGTNGTFNGTMSDIDKDNYNNNNLETAVGCYGKIIQKILELQPRAKIFCCAIPNTRNGGFNTAANNLIKSISELFNCYFLDFQTYGVQMDEVDEWKKIYYNGYHLNSLGYKQFAVMVATYISYIIKNNHDDFDAIPFIGTDLYYN